MIHELKIDPMYFDDISNYRKNFEVRKNDRDYRVGDYLALNELDDTRTRYTGRSILAYIKYILNDEKYCKAGYVILSIKPVLLNGSLTIGQCEDTKIQRPINNKRG